MKVAVIGAGFTGLAAAVELSDLGHKVHVFETEKKVGGLAVGFKDEDWDWPLEIFYHHIFTNDNDIIEMSKRVGAEITFYNPTTSCFIDGEEIRLDSPISALKFPKLTFLSRVRMALGLGILKIIPDGRFLEKYEVVKLLPKLIGKEAYKVVWEKLLRAKFGSKFNVINMAWFWARVYKRTKSLGYFKGGFQELAEKMRLYAEKRGAVFHLSEKMESDKDYDKVISTIPTFQVDYLWGQTLVLELSSSLINSYWLNVLEKDWPFLVVVEHTRMVDRKNYGNKTIVYIGNYLEDGNMQLKMDKDDLLKLYIPFIKKINPKFNKNWIVSSSLFRKPYAQPVFPINYSKILEDLPKKRGKYRFANMSMVYPFDRGTNYAVKMGVEVCKTIC